jgi:hypothetical protein
MVQDPRSSMPYFPLPGHLPSVCPPTLVLSLTSLEVASRGQNLAHAWLPEHSLGTIGMKTLNWSRPAFQGSSDLASHCLFPHLENVDLIPASRDSFEDGTELGRPRWCWQSGRGPTHTALCCSSGHTPSPEGRKTHRRSNYSSVTAE